LESRAAEIRDEIGIPVTVCHLPPGTSKWNKIEHRLFAFTTKNWRGKPLVSHQAIVQLIRATTTHAGLKVRAKLDRNTYPADDQGDRRRDGKPCHRAPHLPW
jgi:hypothetical protein